MKALLAGLVVSLCFNAEARAQVRDRAVRPAGAAAAISDAATLAVGWNAVASGKYDDGVKSAAAILERRPWDRGALVLRISALAAAAPLSGLDAYEQWVNAKHRDDAGLLEPVAIAVLQEIAKGRDAEQQRTALAALAASRVAGASDALDALAADPQNRLARDVDAARSGDTAALERLTGRAATSAGATKYLAQALAELGASGESGLLLLLKSGNPETRAVAAQAVGAIKSDRGRAALQAIADDPDPIVRMSATVSLAQMGDERALTRVDQMLASNVPDLQLAAADAWEGRPGAWVAVVRPLLENPDGLVRLQAARAIAPVDPDAAKRVLADALGDANPAIRYESAKAMDAVIDAQPSVADIPALRQRLRDRDPSVRLAVASALLKLARLS